MDFFRLLMIALAMDLADLPVITLRSFVSREVAVAALDRASERARRHTFGVNNSKKLFFDVRARILS
jgi:hypothetical protein